MATASTKSSSSGWDPMTAVGNVPLQVSRHGGVNFPVENSVTFVQDPDDLSKLCSGEMGPEEDAYMYSREYNPSVRELDKLVAALEGTESAYSFSSGMAAISSALFQLCANGDHIVASNRLYSGTHNLLEIFMPRISGIKVTRVDITDLSAVEAAIEDGKTKVLYFESVSNPVLTVADTPALSAIAHRHGVTVVVDNTFSPCTITPARHGADVVIHSLSKFLNGSADVIAGAVCASREFIHSVADVSNGSVIFLGGTMTAQVASLIASRIHHSGMRVREHSARAAAFARRLHSLGIHVIYPGLEVHPQHEVLLKIMNPGYGAGGLLGVDMGSVEMAFALIRLLNQSGFGHSAVSLGFHNTLFCHSMGSTGSTMDEKDRDAAGILPGLIRMSIGYTGSLEAHWLKFYNALVELKVVPEGAKWEE